MKPRLEYPVELTQFEHLPRVRVRRLIPPGGGQGRTMQTSGDARMETEEQKES